MPYVKPTERKRIDRHLERVFETAVKEPGNLNYAFTKLIELYLGSEVRYQKVNDVVGALECCKLELYRRLAAPYEDKKITENGDVSAYCSASPRK